MLVLIQSVGWSGKLNIDFVAGLIKRKSVGGIGLWGRGTLLGLARLGRPPFPLRGGRLKFLLVVDGHFRGGRIFDPLARLTRRIIGRRIASTAWPFPCVRPRDADDQGIVGKDCEQFVFAALIVEFRLASDGEQNSGGIVAAAHQVRQRQQFADGDRSLPPPQ